MLDGLRRLVSLIIEDIGMPAMTLVDRVFPVGSMDAGDGFVIKGRDGPLMKGGKVMLFRSRETAEMHRKRSGIDGLIAPVRTRRFDADAEFERRMLGK